jgi:hypothetical protein
MPTPVVLFSTIARDLMICLTRKHVMIALAVLHLVLPAAYPVFSQEAEYDIKAEFLERFTRFIEWPPDSSVNDRSVPFVIGLFENPFGDYLKKMAKERVIKGKPIEVRLLEKPDEVLGCDMVYISPSVQPSEVRAILKLTQGRPILSVGDAPGMVEKGVLINLVMSGGHIRFEINREAAEKSGLKMSARLLNLALEK